MPLSGRQKFLIRLKLQHKFKREYFTLVIPVIVALLFFFLSFHFGFAKVSVVGTGFIPAGNSTSSSLSQKQQEIQLILSNSSVPLTSSSTSYSNLEKFDLDVVIVGTLVIAFAPYSIDASREVRRKRKYEEDFASFLFELSELVRGGIDPAKGIVTLSEKSTGSITRFVQNAAKQMQVGYSFEQAMKNLGDAVGSDLVKKYIDLVIQASYSGGSVSGLIQRASADMSTFIAIDKEKRAGLSQYTMILYVGQIILIVICLITVIEFMPDLSSISSVGGAGLNGFLGNVDIQNVTVERDLFYLVIINGFLGGLVIGKVSEGKIKFGLKHALILVLIGLVAWSGFVTPFTSSASQQYRISLVSYQSSGIVGWPMQNELIVRITNTNGQPVNNTDVTFSISPSGSVSPTLVSTDSNGTAGTKVTLGNTAGIYTVTIGVGIYQISVPILAESGSGS